MAHLLQSSACLAHPEEACHVVGIDTAWLAASFAAIIHVLFWAGDQSFVPDLATSRSSPYARTGMTMSSWPRLLDGALSSGWLLCVCHFFDGQLGRMYSPRRGSKRTTFHMECSHRAKQTKVCGKRLPNGSSVYVQGQSGGLAEAPHSSIFLPFMQNLASKNCAGTDGESSYPCLQRH